jgi:hypothetical protein
MDRVYIDEADELTEEDYNRLGSIFDRIKKPKIFITMKSHTEIWYAVIVGDQPMSAHSTHDEAQHEAEDYETNMPVKVERVRITIDRIGS